LSALLVLLIWMWLSAFAVLFGAEINGEAERQTRRDSSLPIGKREAQGVNTVAP
jgi:membrane protein